jgi:transcriptional regulator
MYLPPKFVGDWKIVVQEYPLGSLVTPLAGEVKISWLPFALTGESLFTHFAMGNDHWRAVEKHPSKLLFQGPSAYISPTWYTECDVPTWNYVAVEMDVQGQILSEAELIEELQKMSEHHEGADGWRFHIPADLKQLSKAIVGVRFSLQNAQAKWKLSQNRSPADRAGVLRGLRDRKEKMDLLLADWLEKNV